MIATVLFTMATLQELNEGLLCLFCVCGLFIPFVESILELHVMSIDHMKTIWTNK